MPDPFWEKHTTEKFKELHLVSRTQVVPPLMQHPEKHIPTFHRAIIILRIASLYWSISGETDRDNVCVESKWFCRPLGESFIYAAWGFAQDPDTPNDMLTLRSCCEF